MAAAVVGVMVVVAAAKLTLHSRRQGGLQGFYAAGVSPGPSRRLGEHPGTFEWAGVRAGGVGVQ